MMNRKSNFPALLLLLGLMTVVPLVETGCNKTTLAPGGAYTDPVLFDADLAITTAKQVLDNFMSWEKDNRMALWKLEPGIKHTADHIRKNAKHWFATAYSARDTYESNPTAGNASALKLALAELSTAASQATQYLTLATSNK